MDDFYTKEATAQILRISPRQVNNYFTEGKLSRVYFGRKAYIPKREVDELYARQARGPVISPEVVDTLITRMEKLEKEVRILKLGLGHGSAKPMRSETDLILLRQQMLDDLARTTWTSQRIMKVSKELSTLRPEEVESLINTVGVTAWVPLVDLGKRMLRYVEGDATFPGNGLDILAEKLHASLNRFYGLVYASTRVDQLIDSRKATPLLAALEVPPNGIESHIASYLSK